ncbi:MAG: ROK family protein [Bernardetiaceae bacterium]|nr:ROK family protein [Bernardetiaceae bacterium]
MQIFTGIDIGGSNVKIGLVDSEGNLLEKKKVKTAKLREGGHFTDKFLEVVAEWLAEQPKVKQVGIGVPGTISKNRRATVELPNIPELSHVNLVDRLEKRFPTVHFHIENDAAAAAIGEYHFSGRRMPDNYFLVTLGTGIGGGAVIGRKVFKGGDGNAMEIGHIISGNGRTVEQTIGKAGLVEMATALLAKHTGHSALRDYEKIDDDVLVDAAVADDPVAQQVFHQMGVVLGQALVSTILLLDIKNIFIGGGVAKAFAYIEPGMKISLKEFLTPYYYDKLDIKLAKLGNNAGILGAAALCFKHKE